MDRIRNCERTDSKDGGHDADTDEPRSRQ